MAVQYMLEIFPQFLSVIPITILIVVLSAVFGFLLSIPVAAVRIRRIPVLSQLFGAYISFTRSTPILLQLFLFFFGLMFYVLTRGARVTENNPWNEYADTLEWTLPSPPPEHTFEILPKQEEWDHKHSH